MDPIYTVAESERDELDIVDGSLPWGYHEAGEDLCHRDPSIVETDYEIELHYRGSLENGVRQPVFTCAYCGDQFRSQSLDNALRWWNAHDCYTLEHREALARIYQATDLPAGNPFSPIVDGKQAA